MSIGINFEVQAVPPSVNNIYGVYCDASVKEFKNLVKDTLNEKTFCKITGPVWVDIKFYFKKNNRDVDNAVKVLLDSLNKILYKDDKQVYILNVQKFICKVEKTIVSVSEITCFNLFDES